MSAKDSTSQTSPSQNPHATRITRSVQRSRSRSPTPTLPSSHADEITSAITSNLAEHSASAARLATTTQDLIGQLTADLRAERDAANKLVAKHKAKMSEITRGTTHLRETLQTHKLQRTKLTSEIEALKQKNADLQAQREAAVTVAGFAREKQERAEALLRPVRERLEGLQEMGRRVHDIVIRRVLRLEELEGEWEEWEMRGGWRGRLGGVGGGAAGAAGGLAAGRNASAGTDADVSEERIVVAGGGGGAGASHRAGRAREIGFEQVVEDGRVTDNARLLREISDNTYVLVQGWRRIEGDYVLVTRNGEFVD